MTAVLGTLKDGTVEHAFASVLMRIEQKLDRLLTQTAPRPPADDEVVGRDPSEKYWPGPPHKGSRLSECAPNFLRAYAKYRAACAWAARKNDADKPEKMKYAARDENTAKLATAWAEYREALGDIAPSLGMQQQSNSEPDFGPPGDDSEIPF